MIAVSDDLLALPPFGLAKDEKRAIIQAGLSRLTTHHMERCDAYRQILNLLDFRPSPDIDPIDYPFLPVRLFKSHDLKSVASEEVRTILTSSGTSGQAVSRIALDASTANLQSKILSRIVSDVVGKQRLPLLVVDAPSVVRRGQQFSARAAGIMGFSLFGRDMTYALKDDMSLDLEGIETFATRHAGRPVLVFGFTFMIYQHFIEALERIGAKTRFDQAILIHGGGWKKLQDRSIDQAAFAERLWDVSRIRRVHNYYGLVEQTGSIFMGCEYGHLHCSNFSELVIRDPQFAALPIGQRGLVQLISLLPASYPGHNVLTEDEGTWLGEDDCPCGRHGKYFSIHGRVAQAEIRGCSDTYAA